MTLIVALIVPDGIVLAGDSLSTISSLNVLEGEIAVTCPNCEHQHTAAAKLQGSLVPTTSFPYAQKVFPFLGSFGVGTAGAGQLQGKSIYFVVRQLEKELAARPRGKTQRTVQSVAKEIGKRARDLIHEEAASVGVRPENIPSGYVQFQVVGYDDSDARVARVNVGHTVEVTVEEGAGALVIGRSEVAQGLWGVVSEPAAYEFFSLQDAVDYAEFLITATASHQRFYRSQPTVGGDIDIALVTPFDKFRWIRQKPIFAEISK